MLKKIVFVVVTLLTLSVSYAQSAYFQVITCKGTVVYEALDGTSKEMVPGSKIPAEGNLILSDNSMVKIISKDRPQKLQAPGTYDLSELYFASDKKSMSFTGKFWNYLMKGLHSSDSKAEIKKYGYQTAAGGVKGFSDLSQSEVEIKSNIVGNVTGLPLVFEWVGKESNFSLFDAKNQMVFEASGSNGMLELTNEDVHLVPGTYYWQVASEGKTSPIIPFVYQPVEASKIESKLERITDYVEGDEREKAWIRAVVYEMEGYTYEAGEMYRGLLHANPNDLLMKKLYILYLARNGNIQEAENMID